MKIDWTEVALADLLAINDYVGQDSPYYARQMVDEVFHAVGRLGEHPELGRRVREGERSNIRELLFQGFRIIYQVTTEGIEVLTLVHGTGAAIGQPHETWDVV